MSIQNSSVKLFLAKVTIAILVFSGVLLFAHILSPSQLGSFFLFEALLGLLSIPADFGLRGAAEKRISEGQPADGVFTTVVMLKLIPLGIVAFTVTLFHSMINRYVGAPVATLLIIALFLNEFGKLTLRVLAGKLRVGETAVLSFVRHFVWLVVGAALVFNGFGALGLVYGLIAGYVAMLLWGTYKRPAMLGKPSYEIASSLFSYSKFNFVSHVGGYLYSWMDLAVIGLFLGLTSVGAYEVAWRVATLVTLLSSSIGTAVFPQLSQWSAEDATEQIESLIPEALTPSLMLVIPAFFGTLLFSSEILSLVFGTEYTIAATALMVLMGEKLFQAVHTILGRALQGIDRADLAARAAVATIVLNIILNLVLVWQFGIVGAAVATAVSFFLNTYLHARYLSRFLTIRVNYAEISWCVVAAIGMSLVLFLLQLTLELEIGSLPILLTLIAIGAMVYGVIVLLYPPLRRKIGDLTRTLVRNVSV